MKNIVLTLTTRQELLTRGVLCMLVHEIHGSFASIRAIFSCKCHWLQINIVYITQQCVYGILPKKEKRQSVMFFVIN